jgi:hypothetical protein
MHRVILYSPAIVLAVWCLLEIAGVNGRPVVIVGLACLALALALAEAERERHGRS